MSASLGPTVAFDEIPYDWRVPGTYLELRPSRRNMGLVPFPQRTVLLAPRLTGGTGALNTLLRVTRAEQAWAWGGVGGIAGAMAEAFLANNPTGDLALVLVAEPTAGAAAATGTLTFSGTATVPGGFFLVVAGTRIPIVVNAGDAAAVIGGRVRDAVAARVRLPVTAGGTGAAVALVSRHVGAIGNFLNISVAPLVDGEPSLPTGLTVVSTGMTGGTGVQSFTSAYGALASEWITDWVLPEPPAAESFAEMERRWGAMTRLDALLWAASAPTGFSGLATFGNAQNSRWTSFIGRNGSASPPWVWAAAYAARGIFHLTNDPARQLRGLPLLGVDAPAPNLRFTDTERDLLLRDGVSTFTVSPDRTVLIERAITMSQRSDLGIEDVAWLDVMRPATLRRIRHDWVSYMGLTWPRAKLADDGSPAAEYDPEVATPRRLHASWASRLALYERQGWIQNARECAEQSVFVRDVNDTNRVNARQYVRIMGNLMVLAGALEFEG